IPLYTLILYVFPALAFLPIHFHSLHALILYALSFSTRSYSLYTFILYAFPVLAFLPTHFPSSRAPILYALSFSTHSHSLYAFILYVLPALAPYCMHSQLPHSTLHTPHTPGCGSILQLPHSYPTHSQLLYSYPPYPTHS
ncbi:hypothetical protein BGX38DRAFT_1232947, partial [Terfezia claveryi]